MCSLPKGDALSLPKGDALSLPKGDALSLPKGWEVKKLGEVITLEYGKPLDKYKRIDKGQYPVYGANGIKAKTNEYYYDKKTIIVGRKGSAGEINLTEERFWPLDVSYFVKFEKKQIDLYFLYFWLSKLNLPKLAKGVKPGINRNDVYDLAIPLPPLPEQKRIVAILEKAFTAIDQAKANTEKNLKNARELFQSKLQETFANGKLKIDTGEWEEKKLGEVTLKIGSGATPRGGKVSYKEEGISLIRSMNVHDLHFKEKNLAFIDEQQANALSNVTIQEEDVLLNITGASIARCCIVLKEYLPARVNQHVSIIRAKQEIINPVFLASLLTSKFFKDKILEIGEQGSTRQAITKIQLENFAISFPKSTKKQKQIVKKLYIISTETKKLETIYQRKITCLDELKKSILQKAFNGEL